MMESELGAGLTEDTRDGEQRREKEVGLVARLQVRQAAGLLGAVVHWNERECQMLEIKTWKLREQCDKV